jgi:hypothetical protein
MLRGRIGLGAAAVLLAGCTADKPEPTGFEARAPLFAMGGNSASNLGTHLTGDEEVLAVASGAPHPADSRAQGQAIFRVNADGSAVDFRLIASNIDNVTQAHIHCGASTVNGPIRMWLYPVAGPTGTPGAVAVPTADALGPYNGVLASGTFNPTGVTCPDNTPLLEAIRAGQTYVNVHTKSHDLPLNTNNTGPGDFPGGEIRGQLGDKNN